MTSFQRAPVGNNSEDNHRCGKDQKGDEILTDHVKTLVPEDDASQGMDPVVSGINYRDPAQPSRNSDHRVKAPEVMNRIRLRNAITDWYSC